MKNKIISTIFAALMLTGAAFAQSSWLDRPLNNNWNRGDGIVPNAPRTSGAIDARCREQVRNPESLADRAVTRAGWSLFGSSQSFGPVTLVNAMAGTDGMCRPTQYNMFVFVSNRFAGTLSPTVMDSRSDGSLSEARLISPTSITADFSRYTSADALCCPSQKSSVSFSVTSGVRPTVKADAADTNAACPTDDGGDVTTMDNVVSGTITYRQRIALSSTAVVTVKLVDVSRADASAMTIVERQIETAGKQVPISFDFAYDRSKINENNRYAVQAEIRDGGKLLFISDTSYPVITQGNPRNVDIVVVPVGGGGNNQSRSGSIKGTVSFLQFIALGPNSEVTVRLVDSAAPDATPVAETKVLNPRQIPIPFELKYEPRDINRQRTYELQAEIRVDGKLRFRSANGKQVNLRGNQAEMVDLVVSAAAEEVEAITGKTLSLSKFGTGSLKLGTEASTFLIRASVNVRSDGTADVGLSSLEGTTVFSGKLTYFDETTVRITVGNSGDEQATGQIEIKYAARKLGAITSTNLTLGEANVVVRF